MKAEEFVKSKLPRANAEKQTTKGGDSYWLIRVGHNTMYFSEGETKSKAWTNAKNRILEQEDQR